MLNEDKQYELLFYRVVNYWIYYTNNIGSTFMNRKINLFFNKLSLAWLSCMIFMVQGNLPQLTSDHALIATRTGVITGFLVVLMSFIPLKFHFKLPIFMFIGCFIADIFTHPTHFGSHYTEALCTALLAATFSYVITLSPAGKKIQDYLDDKKN